MKFGRFLPSASNPRIFLGFRDFFPGSEKMSRSEKIVGICATLNLEVLSVPEGVVRCRSQHSTPGGARCLSSASVAQMLAAASIKVMDALFGFPARNDAEWTERELLGRSWRRDWAMRQFRPQNAFWEIFQNLEELPKKWKIRCSGCSGRYPHAHTHIHTLNTPAATHRTSHTPHQT